LPTFGRNPTGRVPRPSAPGGGSHSSDSFHLGGPPRRDLRPVDCGVRPRQVAVSSDGPGADASFVSPYCQRAFVSEAPRRRKRSPLACRSPWPGHFPVRCAGWTTPGGPWHAVPCRHQHRPARLGHGNRLLSILRHVQPPHAIDAGLFPRRLRIPCTCAAAPHSRSVCAPIAHPRPHHPNTPSLLPDGPPLSFFFRGAAFLDMKCSQRPQRPRIGQRQRPAVIGQGYSHPNVSYTD